MQNNWKYQEIETKIGTNLHEYLSQIFPTMSTGALAKHLGVSPATLYVWLRKFGLRRAHSEANIIAWHEGKWDKEAARQRAYTTGFHTMAQGKPSPRKGKALSPTWRDHISQSMTGKRVGENHPLWKGGGGHRYGSGWKRARRLARERANGHCERCHKPAWKVKGMLHVHHKIPVRYFALPAHAHTLHNLIVVCHPCHFLEEKESREHLALFAMTAKPWNDIDARRYAPFKTCLCCEKTFKTRRSSQKYCSQKCHTQSMTQKVERICKECDKHFLAQPAQIKQGHALYCSLSCRTRHLNKLRIIGRQKRDEGLTVPRRIRASRDRQE